MKVKTTGFFLQKRITKQCTKGNKLWFNEKLSKQNEIISFLILDLQYLDCIDYRLKASFKRKTKKKTNF